MQNRPVGRIPLLLEQLPPSSCCYGKLPSVHSKDEVADALRPKACEANRICHAVRLLTDVRYILPQVAMLQSLQQSAAEAQAGLAAANSKAASASKALSQAQQELHQMHDAYRSDRPHIQLMTCMTQTLHGHECISGSFWVSA